MSIQPTDNSYLSSVSFLTTEKVAESSKKSDKSSSSSASNVSLSTDEAALTLTSLSDDLDAASDIDWNKVNDVKNALANGNLTVDLDSLSQAILDMHRS